MEITDLEAVLVSHVYPDDVTLEWSAGRIESWDAALIRVRTDTGLVGWGEAGHALTGTEAVPGLVQAFRSHVVGRDPSNVRAIRRDLYDRNVFWARGALPLGVMGAIEIAIYDILGQARGCPVYELLGGRAHDSVRVYGSGGIAATPGERIEQAVEFADRGFDVVKVRALREPKPTVDYVMELLDTLPSDVSIALDAVQGSAASPWSVKEAIRVGRALEPHADRLYWYEEPCRAEDLGGYARVRDAVDLRIAGIESRAGRHEFRDVIVAGAVDVLHADVTISGGFGTTRTVGGYADANDIPMAMHVWGTGVSQLANCHYAITDPNCEIAEYCQLPNPLREAFLPEDFTHENGRVHLPDRPGLGLEIPEHVEEEYPFQPGMGYVFE